MASVRSLISAMTVAALAVLVALVGQAGGPVRAGALNVDQGDVGCSLTGSPYCTIEAAVEDAQPGDTIHVFPGTYAESVDLSEMSAPGDISLVSVDAGGTPTASTVAIESPAGAAIETSAGAFPGAVTIDGFTVSSPDDNGIFVDAGGPVTIRNVTASDNGEDGVLIRGNNHPVNVSDSQLNGNAGDGLNVFSSSALVTVTNVTANENDEDGMELNVGGDVEVSGSTASGNLGIGFGGNGIHVPTSGSVTVTDTTTDSNLNDGVGTDVASETGVSGLEGASEVTIVDSSSSGNGDDGYELDASGTVTVTNSTTFENGDDGFDSTGDDVVISGARGANNGDRGFEIAAFGDISIVDSTAGDNDDRGFHLEVDGTLSFERTTSSGNGNDGLNFNALTNDVDNATVRDSLFQDNEGEALDYPTTFGVLAERDASGNIICGNEGGFDVDGPASVNVEGNWWGAASGPTHPSNPGGSGDEVFDAGNGSQGTADFTPWIDTIDGTNGQATQGQPKVVTFEFTGGGGAVALTEGPGDPSGGPVFAAATDNGVVETTGFIENGVLEVVLTADAPGTATVTVNGPCGLGDSVGGNSVEVEVIAGLLVAWGDDDCNGAVNAVDGLKNLQELAGIPYEQEDPCFALGAPVGVSPAGGAQQLLWGDVDCDGDVDSVDALGILRSVAALPVAQEPGCPMIGDGTLVAEAG